MADIDRGLDLSVFETATDAESDQFRSFYRDKLGTPHRGLDFWLDVERPDVLKRYRANADDGTPRGLETVRKVGGFSFFVSYAMSGSWAGSGPLPGSFRAGNVVAHPFASAYPGGGGTLGPAVTFGHVAGKSVLSEGHS